VFDTTLEPDCDYNRLVGCLRAMGYQPSSIDPKTELSSWAIGDRSYLAGMSDNHPVATWSVTIGAGEFGHAVHATCVWYFDLMGKFIGHETDGG